MTSSKATLYGFIWGPIFVERCADHEGHRVLQIKTKKQSLQIRVTPSGFIRIEGGVKKREAQGE